MKDSPTINDAIKLVMHGISSKHIAGSMIVIRALGNNLNDENKVDLLLELIANVHRDKRAILAIKEMIGMGVNVNHDKVKAASLRHTAVLHELLQAGMILTLENVRNSFSADRYCPATSVYNQIFKRFPTYRKELARELIRAAFIKSELGPIRLIAPELKVDEVITIIRDVLAEEIRVIDEHHERRKTYKYKSAGWESIRNVQLCSLAKKLVKLTKGVPKWREYHQQILDQTDGELVAAVAAAELEG